MNLKIVLGIFIPLLVIIGLVIMSSVDVGFSLNKQTLNEILYADLFKSNYQSGETSIQTLTIKNDYFLDKRIDLPKIMVCLYDKESKIISQNLNVRYNTGKAVDIPADPITGIASEMAVGQRYYSYGSYTAERNVDVPAHSTKEVKLMIQPKYSYDYYYNSGKYDNSEFDELLILEPDDEYSYYSYDTCSKIDDENVEDAEHIKINKNNIPGVTCETITDAYNRDKCYSGQATKTLNSTMCRKISQIYDRDTCFGNLARSLKEVGLCHEIVQTGKDMCFYDLASLVRDSGICDRIVDVNWKNSCYSAII